MGLRAPQRLATGFLDQLSTGVALWVTKGELGGLGIPNAKWYKNLLRHLIESKSASPPMGVAWSLDSLPCAARIVCYLAAGGMA